MPADNSYPADWDTPAVRTKTPVPLDKAIEAVSLAVDSYVAALSPAEFSDLVARTRPGGR
jgi:hypothetical protein